jgi:hypothetical protein
MTTSFHIFPDSLLTSHPTMCHRNANCLTMTLLQLEVGKVLMLQTGNLNQATSNLRFLSQDSSGSRNQVLIPIRDRDFSLVHNTQPVYGPHSTCTVDSGPLHVGAKQHMT